MQRTIPAFPRGWVNLRRRRAGPLPERYTVTTWALETVCDCVTVLPPGLAPLVIWIPPEVTGQEKPGPPSRGLHRDPGSREAGPPLRGGQDHPLAARCCLVTAPGRRRHVPRGVLRAACRPLSTRPFDTLRSLRASGSRPRFARPRPPASAWAFASARSMTDRSAPRGSSSTSCGRPSPRPFFLSTSMADSAHLQPLAL